MRRTLRSLARAGSIPLVTLALAAACAPQVTPGGDAAADARRDTGATPPPDTNPPPPLDAPAADAVAMDAPPATDALSPPGDGADTDGAASDAPVVPPGCNPDGGIECDGDWADRCSPACAASECCSPQSGAFRCMPRDAMGRCPAADLFPDSDRVRASVRYQFVDFDSAGCAVVERCVDAPGRRRLLRFDTRTPNIGTADMYLGVPSRTNPNFEFSACHNHYHFNSYAAYELRRTDGTVAARGHKQAFCLLDLDRYSTTGSSPTAHYTCSNQGIQMGWADIYSSGLDCQWVDITDVPPGDYVLHIAINGLHILNELDYSNNVIDVPLTVPAGDPFFDPTAACTTSMMGVDRDCGWTVTGPARTCTPGTRVTAACSATCGLGSCTGDSMIRVYEGDRTAAGALRGMSPLSQNDDSGCMVPAGSPTDLCSRTMFNCPASGTYTVATAPYRTTATMTCNVATSP